MITIGTGYKHDRAKKFGLTSHIDADRSVSIFEDSESSTLLISFRNGEMFKDIAVSHEAANALLAVLAEALAHGMPEDEDG